MNGTVEFKFARDAFVDRHPVAKNWLEVHGMVLCKLDIQQILVIDFYGGAKNVSVADYYKVKADSAVSIDTDEQQNDLVDNLNVVSFDDDEEEDSDEPDNDNESEELGNGHRHHHRRHPHRRHRHHRRVHIRVHESHGGEVIDIFA